MSDYHLQGQDGGELLELEFVTADPLTATPAAGKCWAFFRSDGLWIKKDSGQEIKLAFGSGFLGSIVDYAISDDFTTGSLNTGAIGQLGWNRTGGGAIIGLAPETDHPGIIRITGTNSMSAIFLRDASDTGELLPLSEFTLDIFSRNAGNLISQMKRLGIMQRPIDDPPADGIYFEYDTDNSDTNWKAVTRASSVQTKTDTGVPVVLSSFRHFRIFRDGSDIVFEIDLAEVARHSTNVPTIGLVSTFHQKKRAGPGDPNMDVDFFRMFVPNIGRV